MRPASRPASWPGMFGTALLSVQDANDTFHANSTCHVQPSVLRKVGMALCVGMAPRAKLLNERKAIDRPQTCGSWCAVTLGLAYLSCLPCNDQSHPLGCPCSFRTTFYLPGPPSWPPIPRRMAAMTPVRPILPARMPARGSGAGSSRFQKACCSCASIVSSHTASSMYA